MRRIAIGVHVHAEPDRLRMTLASLRANTTIAAELLLLADGPDPDTRAALASLGDIACSETQKALGVAACFNRLISHNDAEILVLLESGCMVGRRWLDHLLAALDSDPQNGMAGPSTNQAWNEQCIFRHGFAPLFSYSGGSTQVEVDRVARAVQHRFGKAHRPLTPLHSLADFCYVVRREVAAAIGAADESYGLGPCWEMDYNIRAARAGFGGVWACSAYVQRAPFTSRRAFEEERGFQANKHRYQDKFCALRLRGERTGYEDHCKGDECEHFAPASLIQIHLPLSAPVPPKSALCTPLRDSEMPLVSCIMATQDRRDFVLQSVRYFQRQDYPNRELLILDDGNDNLSAELPDDERIRYLRFPHRMTIGAKRNRGCELARGSVIAHWDDDDWYAPNRLSAQVTPLLTRGFHLSALTAGLFFDLDRWEFWRCAPTLHQRMFVGDVHGGTLVFKRSLFVQGLRYPDRSLAEDAWFLFHAQQRGARVHKLPGDELFVYLRHARSSWQFTCGEFIDPKGWQRAFEPNFDEDDRAFYRARSAASPPAPARVSGAPLASCILPTANRRALVPQAIRYFLRQDYPERELLILDDGRDSVADLVPNDPCIRYVRLAGSRTLGAKRNLACEMANGEFIVHWDDDDWMADWRLSYQMRALSEQPQKDICGLARVFFYDPRAHQAWIYVHPPRQRAWVAGNTLCYRKSLWQHHRFPNVNEGEDTLFVWALNESQMHILADPSFYVATVHSGNTSPKRTHNPGWQKLDVSEVSRLLKDDLPFYESWQSNLAS